MTTETENDLPEESIGDTIRAAMAESETPATDDAPQERVSDRDEKGRFAAKQEAEAAPAAEPTDSAAQEGKWSPERPPSSWTPKARESWNSLPLEVRQEITRREENHMNGARQLQQRYAPVMEFQQQLEPVSRELQHLGLNPVQHISSVMNTERVLRTGDVPTKFDAILKIADQYGVPLREVINESVGQEILKRPATAAAALPPEVAQEINAMREWREQQEFAYVSSEVESFGSKLEFFNDVRHQMADFVERGLVTNLKDAYEMAIWSTPDVREVLMSRQTTSAPRNQVRSRQERAVSTGVRPSGAVHVALDTDDAEDSIADTIRKSMEAVQGRL